MDFTRFHAASARRDPALALLAPSAAVLRGAGGRLGHPGPGVGPANSRRRVRTPDGPAVAAAAPGAAAPQEDDRKRQARETTARREARR